MFGLGGAISAFEGASTQHLITIWDDPNIWRYQKYVERPPLPKVDAKPYMVLRKWPMQFSDVPPTAASA
jgi:3-ketosteroid 9alpha-monooxygenase subunit A